ncbi:hypothetical protein G7Y79_00012g033390 [Physcia stellaris]|nr:hypothetical protein G7Y79_00012g033390 [Physcia stellaris]
MQTTKPPIFASEVNALFESPTIKLNFCVFLNAAGIHLSVSGAEEVARLTAQYFDAEGSSFVEPNWEDVLKLRRPTNTAPGPLFVGSTHPTPNTDPNTNPNTDPNTDPNTNPNTDPNPNPRETEKEQASNPPPEEAPSAPQYTPCIASREMLDFLRLLNGLQNFLGANGYKVELLDVTRFTGELRRFLEECQKDLVAGERMEMAEGKGKEKERRKDELGGRMEERVEGTGRDDEGAGRTEGTWASRHLPKGGFPFC